MKTLKYTMPLTVALACAIAVTVTAGDDASPNKYSAILHGSPTAEMPAQAANLVAKADAKGQKQTTIEVVKAAVGLNPAAAIAIVGSISRTTPSMAPTAAATAVSLLPHKAAAIAKAAAGMAPSQVRSIVAAVCKVVPAAYPNVAAAVAEVAPGNGKEILVGISESVPQLKGSIDKTLSSYSQENMPSVSSVIDTITATSPSFALASVSGGSSPNILLSQNPIAPTVHQIFPNGPSGGGSGSNPTNNQPVDDPTNGTSESEVSP